MSLMKAILTNTYQQGVLTFISYPSSDGTYIAACNELCLLVEEKDMQLARLSILAKAKSYWSNVCESKLGENLLNQSLPEEIVDEFKKYVKRSIQKKTLTDEFEKWAETWEKKSGKMKTSSSLTAA